jgi:MFS family permease
VVGVVVSAFSGAAFRMVGPVYALENGLDQGQIAVFLAAGILGGVIAQYPVGWIADKMNRRWVMIWLSVAAIAGCLAMAAFIRPGDVLAIYLGMAFFGATTLPIFSVASAYANDFAEEDFVVELNSALIFFFSVGAVTAPVLAARLISLFGPDAFFLFISGAHVGLIAFAIYRMTRREARGPTVPYRYTPRTSMVLARLFRQEDVHAKPEARIEAPEERTSR